MSDEHAPHFSSVYGNAEVPTPALERLATQGMTFDAAYCAAPLCVPSRAAFMTGRYPSRIGCYDNGSPFGSDIATIAHVLRGEGYETVLIGKMHFIGDDQLHGFEHRPVGDDRVCSHAIDAPDWSNEDETIADARSRLTNSGAGRTNHIDQDEDVLEAALRYLERLADRADRPPVFLCVSFNAPHFPLKAPPRYFERFAGVSAPRLEQQDLAHLHPFHKRLRRYFDLEGVDQPTLERARQAYFGLVAHLDEMIGRVLEEIDRSFGPGAPPVVAYVSDHGEMAGEHGLWWKCCMFEQSVRIPMIIRLPGATAPGARCRQPVSLLDLTATIADIAGARPGAFQDNLDGESLVALLAGEAAPDPDRAVLAEYCAHAAQRPIRMIRQGDWKYIHYPGEPDELYNLSNDPGELENRARDPGCAGIVERLQAALLADWPAAELDSRIRASQRERRLIASSVRDAHG